MNQKIWAMLVHLGYNMWNEVGNNRRAEGKASDVAASPVLRLDRPLWDDFMLRMQKGGTNTLIIDIGEGMRYESHPELAAEGAWTREEMEKELARLRSMGFDVVPKLNFSACHDEWLKEYSRMLSTPRYYEVCADLIKETIEIFKPKYFHLGMDEENYRNQRFNDYVAIRQNDLWWHDFYFLADCVEKENIRPWIWSDAIWEHPDEFLAKMPKSVLQSNWYYGREFENAKGAEETYVRAFDLLESHGFDQVPTGSNWTCRENMELLTKYCTEHISDPHLFGFMQSSWLITQEHRRADLMEAADTLADSVRWYESR